MKQFNEYLPKRFDTALIQGRVPKELLIPIRAIMTKHNLSWSELLTACFRKLIDETGKKKGDLL